MNLKKILIPDWGSLTEEQLKRYRNIGFLVTLLGAFVLYTFVPTIKIGFKILGALLFGYGLQLFYTANTFLKKNL